MAKMIWNVTQCVLNVTDYIILFTETDSLIPPLLIFRSLCTVFPLEKRINFCICGSGTLWFLRFAIASLFILLYFCMFVCVCVCVCALLCMWAETTQQTLMSLCASILIFCKTGLKNLLIRLKLGLSHPFCKSVSVLIICGIIIPVKKCMCAWYVCVCQ